MHSSRMRTAGLLPVSPSMHCTGRGISVRGCLLRGCRLWGGVCSGRGSVCSQGVSAQGGFLLQGVCSGGCLLWGGVCAGRGSVCSQGVSAQGQGGFCSRGSALGGVCSGGGCLLPGVCIQACMRQTPPCEQNH